MRLQGPFLRAFRTPGVQVTNVVESRVPCDAWAEHVIYRDGKGELRIERTLPLRPRCDVTRPNWSETWRLWEATKVSTLFLCGRHARECGFVW